MNIVKYSDDYFSLFLDCFISFGEDKGQKINKEVILKNLDNKLKQDSSNLYLYLLDNKVIGFLWAKVVLNENIFLKSYNKLHISYLYIMKEYTGRGYSSELKNHLLEKNKDIKKIGVYTNISNINAISIYKKWGFKERKYYMNLDL
ncbi:MAG: GNAT family N-acetyltransferase [Candidatus Gracilibacteria bacterium]|nr:GNAT family N-acetyltransferase [Candidatus Gracilibacteria bacterium]